MSTDTDTLAATGEHTTAGLPHVRTSLSPHLVASPAREAIELYCAAFGARSVSVTGMGELIAHAELELARGRFTVSDPMPGYGLVAAEPGDHPVGMSLAVYVPDVDAAVRVLADAGGTVREQPTNFVSGDRFASVVDPYGIRWSVMCRVEDLSPEQSDARVARWARSQ
ncbi:MULTISPECIES: VOC family protein [Pseudonocardia]|uniref:Glyoxalase-like domain protein n=2 Tax=Pseudonocardia TaxID=1847 RepID=A0A1Y2N146_PSEAH|nr:MULTISPECIES: glyoxalase/bleomycin resistance/extradiol dioxygenase family protein [Pseudonocardia]OSY41183.1 Glyoxalase-like domain protein [Pseudonocardia autotrophica]TDN76639.1 putative glyoxalase superfamily protein PhnB [Pseudonocardia autotrophica]